MKARLIKSEDVYFLVDNSEIEIDCHYLAWDPYYATGKWVRYVLSNGLNGTKQFKIIGSTLDLDAGVHKLSLKNCQAIERGYDLDDIKKKIFNGFDGCPDSFTLAAVERTIEIMMELIGDKKFSEEDMGKAWSEGYHRKVDEINGNELRYFDKFIQSLQKTEWDVEIEDEPYYNRDFVNDGKTHIIEVKKRPVFDENSCIVLKRV